MMTYYDPDYYEGERIQRAFCDNYAPHEPHAYPALNGNVYDCPGFTDEDAAELEADRDAPPCEHGLSAALCMGDEHYGSYADERAREGY